MVLIVCSKRKESQKPLQNISLLTHNICLGLKRRLLFFLVIQALFNMRTYTHSQLDHVYQMLAGHRWTVEVTAALCENLWSAHQWSQSTVRQKRLKNKSNPQITLLNITLC